MSIFSNMVGRKIIMAASGLIMILFLLFHFLGNTSLFRGPDGINAYAAMLQGLGPFIWSVRLVMVSVLLSHVIFGTLLTVDNWKTRPEKNSKAARLTSSFMGRTMIWSGLVIGSFIVYHLLHFTFHVTNPDIAASHMSDAAGRPDVFAMVILSFRRIGITLAYAAALGGVGLHLSHGIQSLFQTLGLTREALMPLLKKAGMIAAFMIFMGFVSIPLSIFFGYLKI